MKLKWKKYRDSSSFISHISLGGESEINVFVDPICSSFEIDSKTRYVFSLEVYVFMSDISDVQAVYEDSHKYKTSDLCKTAAEERLEKTLKQIQKDLQKGIDKINKISTNKD